jgi:hypothetical protein
MPARISISRVIACVTFGAFLLALLASSGAAQPTPTTRSRGQDKQLQPHLIAHEIVTGQASAQSYPIQAGSITQWGTGTSRCEYPNGQTQRGFGKPIPIPCAWINTPPPPASPFAVTYIAPKGAVEFQFVIALVLAPATAPAKLAATAATYTVTATANDSSGNSTTGSGTATLTLAKAGSTHAILKVPINIDSAEATIRFQYDLSQNPGGPITLQQGNSVLGPFKLAITPIAAFQLPAVPIAILYAPLGNKGTSQLTFTNITGTNAQVTISQTNSTTTTKDNRTTLSGGLSWAKLAFTVSGAWDNSVETGNTDTYGQTNSIVTTDQVSLTYGPLAAASFSPAPLSLDKMLTSSTSDQPFWHDQFLLALNSQYAVWDYPSGPIVQPLGNVHISVVSVAELDDCSKGTGDTVSYPGPVSSATTLYITLTPQDCSNILALDQFYVKRSQSGFPNNFRQFAGVSTDTTATVQNTQTVTSATQTNTQTSFTSKATSTRTNSLAASASIPIPPVPGLTLSVGGSKVSTNTTVQGATITYQAVDTQTATNSFTATTMIQDTYLDGVHHANFNVVQDLDFQGLAVQDTDMSWSQTSHMKKIKTRFLPANLSAFSVILPNESTADLPMVAAGSAHPQRLPVEAQGRVDAQEESARRAVGGSKPQRYVRDSGYDWVVITEPSAQQKAAARAQAQQLFSAASKRHIQKPVPKPAPALAVPISADEAIKFVNRLAIPQARVQEFTDAVKGSIK